MKTHPCPIPECRALIPDAHLMCAHHWHQVPQAIQRGVNKSWRELKSRRPAASRLAAVRSYRQLADAAVQSVINALSPVQ